MHFPDLALSLCMFPLVNLLPCAGMHWRSKHEVSSAGVLQTCASLLLPGEGQLHWHGDGPCLFKGMFVLLCITVDQVLRGALQSELNSSPPLLPGWQGQVGRAELSEGVSSCGRMGSKVHFLATWIDREFSDLDGALLRPRVEAGSVFCSPFPLRPPLLKGELACFPPELTFPQPSAVF